jgi:predicted nucleotidyltransferase
MRRKPFGNILTSRVMCTAVQIAMSAPTPSGNLAKRIADVFGYFPKALAVYLFGSVAEGRAGPHSDLELAVVPANAAARGRHLDILAALVAVGLDDVDLAILDGADVVLRFKAVRPNHLVYAREGFDHGAYYSRAVREYFDLLPILAIQGEALKRRLLRAGLADHGPEPASRSIGLAMKSSTRLVTYARRIYLQSPA